jgi:hypothetical protein
MPRRRFRLPGMLFVLACGLTSLAGAPSAGLSPVPAPDRAAAVLNFAENRGQWPDDVRYAANVPGAVIALRATSMTCVLSRTGETTPAEDGRSRPASALAGRESLRLRVDFPGARRAAEPVGEAPSAHVSHYYTGSDPARWRTNVPSFTAVRYDDIHPGIDLVYHGRSGRLEYDFEVQPGADWKRIRVRYDGIERLETTPAGDLAVTTRFGRVVEAAPVAWQVVDGERVPVEVAFRILDRRTFTFDVRSPLDPTATLVIDPILHYGTYLGGSSFDEAHGIDFSPAGEAWVVGGTLSPDFPATGTPVPSTNYSAYVTRLAADGQTQTWSVFLGGSADQIAYGLDLDANLNAFVSGTTGSNDFPTTSGCYDATFNGTNPGELDMFVTKLSPAGTLLYSTYLGGPDSDTNSGLALNTFTGEVYISGDAGNNYPTTAGCYDATPNGGGDVVVSVLSPAGLGPADLVYSTYLGGNDSDESHGIAVNPGGNAIIGGATRSPDFPAVGGPPFNGSFDAFLAEIAPLGGGPADLIINEKFGGAGQDYGTAVAVDFIGVALTGVTTSSNFPTTSGAYQTTYGGGPYDGFVVFALPSSSFLFYSTLIGGSGSDRPEALHLTPSGVVTVSGYTNSSNFPTTAGAWDQSYNGGWDMVIARLDQAGATLLEGTFIGGSQDDVLYDYAVDLLGRRYITGTTRSLDFPTTPTAFDTSFSGGAIDGVVLKFQPELPESCAACYSPPDTCCARRPRFQGAVPPPSPALSPNVLIGTREAGNASPYAVTVFDLNSPTPTEDVDWNTVVRYNGPGAGWRADSLGSVFGLTVDDFGNIFVTHTSCYDQDAIGLVAGAGPGVVYRIDAITGAIGVFCRLPNYPDPNVAVGQNYPGLGNISYDCRNRQFFVTNLEDGRIYRIKANGTNGPTGTIQEVFDPFVADTGPTNWTVPVGSVPQPGWAPLGERLWGVQWHGDRVYYGVWREDIGAPSALLHNEVRSVGLTAAGAFNASSDQHELFLPPMPGVDYSMPVSDISFHATGKMLLGERGITNESYANPHVARNLEYACEAGCWLPANLYQLGFCCVGANASGGVDYDNFPYTGGPLGRVWGTAEAIHLGYPSGAEIFGYQGSRPTGGSNMTAILIDDDGNVQDVDKSFLGDVEAPGCPNDDFGQVCGRKFNDANRNGIQDNGESGLPGWPIVLNGPGGPYTLVTDELGYFCFYDLVPGNYTLSEVTQPGWVQTAPPGGSYAIVLAAGQNLGGLDFGNYWCAGASPCIPPPSGMSAWYAFDEAPGAPATADHAHLDPARNALALHGGATTAAPGRVGNALALYGPGAYAGVPVTEQLGLDFGDGSFALDAWLYLEPGAQSPRVIAEKRTLVSEVPYRTRGWALYLDGTQLKLEIGTPEVTETFTGPTVTPGAWTHVAVSVDRTLGTGGAWYLDGAPSPGFTFSPPAGSLFTTADLTVGRRHPAMGFAVPFDGFLDELQFFHSPLSTASVAALAAAANGKCREFARVPAVTSICKDKPTVQVCVNIVNNTTTSQNYHWSVAGQPAGPGCTVNGPVTFSPSAGTVTVPAGGTSAPICITMTRPAGLTAQNATACFEFLFVNDATGVCFSRTGKIRADNSCWCVTPAPASQSVVPVVERIPSGIVIGIKKPCDPIAILDYRVTALYEPTEHPDPVAVSLNGLPPGTPVFGSVQLDSLGETDVVIEASFPGGYDPAGFYQVVMEADTDGDSLLEVVASVPIASRYTATPLADVPGGEAPPTPTAVRLSATPNPFRAGVTLNFELPVAGFAEVDVYDLAGRLVRRLYAGRLDAGPGRLAWDGRDDAGRDTGAGIYFVRLRAGEAEVRSKVVRLQ